MMASPSAENTGALSKFLSAAAMSMPCAAALATVVSSHRAPAAVLFPSTPSDPPLSTVAGKFIPASRRAHSRTNC
jgi:hypothetical protein